MSLTIYGLRDSAGVEVFRGTIDPPPGGGSLPDGWTVNDPSSGDLDANGGNFDGVSVLTTDYAQILQNLILGGQSMTLQTGVADPSAAAGVSAPVGSIYIRSNGQLWQKTGAGNTAWTQLGAGAAGDTTIVRVPIEFDDAGILAGIAIYTPSVGDVLLYGGIYALEAWDGTSPTGFVFPQGKDDSSSFVPGANMTLTPDDTYNTLPDLGYMGCLSVASMVALTTTPWVASVRQPGGADPGSTQGAGEVLLVIVKA